MRLLPNPVHRDLLALLLRLVLGGAYQLLPFDVAGAVGYGLPVLELAVGVLLILGLFTRVSAVIAGLLMVVFIIGIASAWARGLSIDCGCFGKGGTIAASQTQYPQEIARDVGLLACAVWLAVRPRSTLSLDGLLSPAGATRTTSSTRSTR
jgi:uncharacterized membrane protein YphA (DoxX/SURF4 family)